MVALSPSGRVGREIRPVVSRSPALGAVPEGGRSADFGGSGGRAGVEVFAAQAVTVAFEGEDFGVVDEPVDHRGGGHVVAAISPHLLNGLFEVTIIEARS